MIRLLHASTDSLFCRKFADYCSYLQDVYYHRLPRDKDVLEIIQTEAINVVLLDMAVEPCGGLAVLTTIRTHFAPHEVGIALYSASSQSEDVLRQGAEQGADYFLLRPLDLVVLEKRLREIVFPGAVSSSQSLSFKQVQEICTGFFERMGVPPQYKGYRYLIKGIWLASLHPSWLNAVTQDLYPAIAQRFGVSGSQVERTMRYALDITWEKGNLEELYTFFPYVRENKGKPTNAIFIATMVDLVNLESEQFG